MPSKRLILFPYAGGGASSYAGLTKCLSEEWNITVINRMPRTGVAPFQLLAEVIEFSHNMLLDQLDIAKNAGEKVYIYGHSLGALIAIEAVSRLHLSAQRSITCVSVSGAPGPSFERRAPDGQAVCDLSDDQLIAKIQRNRAAPRELLARDILLGFLPWLRVEFSIAEQVMAKKVDVACPLNVLVGLKDEVVPFYGWFHWRRVSTSVRYIALADAEHDMPSSHANVIADHLSMRVNKC